MNNGSNIPKIGFAIATIVAAFLLVRSIMVSQENNALKKEKGELVEKIAVLEADFKTSEARANQAEISNARLTAKVAEVEKKLNDVKEVLRKKFVSTKSHR